MGQKVHPVGFRVGITKPYQSQWFARFHKYQYSQTILEDRLLRQTLMTLFPTLLNPFLKKIQKREDNTTLSPKITHIKIERGLIPYQIGIQIHAENCDVIKSAIDNLTVNKELLANLQKARRYLFLLKMKPSGLRPGATDPIKDIPTNTITSSSLSKGSSLAAKEYNKMNLIPRNKNTLQKRLRKRQEIKKSLMVLQKKTSRFSVMLKKNTGMSLGPSTASFKRAGSQGTSGTRAGKQTMVKKQTTRIQGSKSIGSSSCSSLIRNIATASSNKTKGAAFDVFLNKTQKSFLKHLKEQMKYWNDQMQKKDEVNFNLQPPGSPVMYSVGYNKNWSLKALGLDTTDQSQLKSLQSLSKLTKLVQIIEKKAFIKMDRLRYDFVSSGPLSKAQTFGYYQILQFLKHLKEYIKKQRIIRVREASAPNPLQTQRTFNQHSTKVGWGEKGIRQRLSNIEEECRKIKFIEFLKGIVQKHRQENIYFYLSTIAESRKNLRKIQQFTKRHSNLLFGFNFNTGIFKNTSSEYKAIRNQIKTNLQQPTELQEVFLKQIEKQRKISQENCELTPKISFKFYSAPPSVLETKASIVADSIVDALEKRQAFRKVIKQAMAKAMKNTRVKGVKIQVAGRLNGAEIARTEWARSGRVPLQTLTANIDYSYKTAHTIYGIIGIKVWIFKGYTKTLHSK